MSLSLEHDYIGLSDASSSSSSSSTLTAEEVEKSSNALNLKETELRLGLPGSVSPDRKGVQDKSVYGLGLLKKRGFSDAIDGDGMWVFAGGNGSEADLGKGGVLFSPRGGNAAAEELGRTPALKDCGSSQKPAAGVVLHEKKPQISAANEPAAKAQVVGWPPIRSFRKNTMATNLAKDIEDADSNAGSGCMYVKVSMDGAPYLRKVDLKTYGNYKELSSALEKMFSCFTLGQCGSQGVPGRDGLSESRLMDLLHGSEYVLTYEDKDGDWMLVGDVPWDMFTASCKRLRIMKGSEAIGLAPRAMEKCKNRN
ncbi:auxin-responsive protein IAA27-like [Magnolia sinica]|uniref:auxin-responsive protein IAA27-like n=1 Tax=Magnolia sinica TaxID=86752 RepID=UPI00265A1396|nr:auxin-responsive protein IAA27-like [Magnolia sinica]